ncbi:MAG TPA: sigma-70 family RNA polymerase sigma factor [Blastocatellia bacterium]|nr:sigma-70 family RNA polymerase sigma factor [Blastocatellia bacterium]
MSPTKTKNSENTAQLLNDFSNGDADAAARLIPIVYHELRQIAEWHMSRERTDHTLQPTALVNEVYLRLFNERIEYSDRGHFLAVASRIMRRLLVDHSRRLKAERRQGDRIRIPIDEVIHSPQETRQDLVALNDALSDFGRLHPRASQVVEMRFFGGFQLEEIADALGISLATVKRDWSFAQIWLYSQLQSQPCISERD